MNSYQLAQLYRRYADEADSTFLEDADVATHLQVAYDEFRSLVNSINPHFYKLAGDLTLPAASGNVVTLFLAGGTPAPANTPSLMGPTPNILGIPVARLERIVGIELLQGGTPVGPIRSSRNFYTSPGYLFSGQTLQFSQGYSGSQVRIHYIPQQSIGVTLVPLNYEPTWATAITFSGARFIDDLGSFHDLIALMALEQYAILDGAKNEQVMTRIAFRKRALESYLQSMDEHGAMFVSRDDSDTEGYW